MDKNRINDIKSSLKKYEEIIEETDRNFDRLEIHGQHCPSSPYLFKYGITLAIERYEKEGADLSEIKDEYEKINQKLVVFMQKRDKAYPNKVFDELKHYVDTYYATICFFLESDPVDMETENDLAGRDLIEILLKELDNEYDLHDLKIKVAALDEALKCQFKSNMGTIMNECPDIEKDCYPENFWWRHHSKL